VAQFAAHRGRCKIPGTSPVETGEVARNGNDGLRRHPSFEPRMKTEAFFSAAHKLHSVCASSAP
jgi:hypothetical protein